MKSGRDVQRQGAAKCAYLADIIVHSKYAGTCTFAFPPRRGSGSRSHRQIRGTRASGHDNLGRVQRVRLTCSGLRRVATTARVPSGGPRGGCLIQPPSRGLGLGLNGRYISPASPVVDGVDSVRVWVLLRVLSCLRGTMLRSGPDVPPRCHGIGSHARRAQVSASASAARSLA